MKIRCETCKKLFDKKNEKGMQYIPNVCSSKCFIFILNNRPVGFAKLPDYNIEEFMINNKPEFRSNYEVRFAKWLDKALLMWMYEIYLFELLNSKKYLPDFLLPLQHTFIEVKGLWEGGAYPKFQKFIKETNYRTFLITDSFLRKLEKII